MSESLSIIIPCYNEEESIGLLYENLCAFLKNISNTIEIIFINDGSKDTTSSILNTLAQQDSRVKVIHFAKNYGQTASMMAGIDHASGEIIIAMDADGQNDPQDISKLLEKIKQGKVMDVR